jgi:hypothetical protein
MATAICATDLSSLRLCFPSHCLSSSRRARG